MPPAARGQWVTNDVQQAMPCPTCAPFPTPATPHRLAPLDTLRGFALMGVMAVHTVGQAPTAWPALNGLLAWGRLGVLLFFAISGYTMMLVWAKGSNAAHPARAFWAKRLMRLWPLYAAASVAMGAMYHLPTSHVLANLTFMGGLHPATINSVVPGGWSILNEALFYLMFPLLVRWVGTPWKLATTLLLAAALSATLSLTAPALWPTVPPLMLTEFTYFNLASHLACFVLGMLAFAATRGNVKPLIAMACVAVGGGLVAKACVSSSVLMLTSVVGAAAALAIVGTVRFKLNVAPLSWLGQRTYTGYLLHFGVLKVLGMLVYGLSFWGLFPLTVLATAALAHALQPLTEHVGQRWGQWLAVRWNR
ncbi:MAG: acyltransferase [Alphaproteobacteria bacterium]